MAWCAVELICDRVIAPGLVDSALKLQLILLFHRHPLWCGGAGSLSEWLRESPWAIEEALEPLADAGFLARIEEQGKVCYRLEPSLECWDMLERMVACYEDPLRRDELYTQLRLADQERRFRAWLAAEEQAAISGGFMPLSQLYDYLRNVPMRA